MGLRVLRGFSDGGLVEVIGQFLGMEGLVVTDTEFEFSFLGPKHDRLALHAPDHVKGRSRLAAQGQFQEILLDPGLDGFS